MESTNPPAMVRFNHPARVIEAANTSFVNLLDVLRLITVPFTLLTIDTALTL